MKIFSKQSTNKPPIRNIIFGKRAIAFNRNHNLAKYDIEQSAYHFRARIKTIWFMAIFRSGFRRWIGGRYRRETRHLISAVISSCPIIVAAVSINNAINGVAIHQSQEAAWSIGRSAAILWCPHRKPPYAVRYTRQIKSCTFYRSGGHYFFRFDTAVIFRSVPASIYPIS